MQLEYGGQRVSVAAGECSIGSVAQADLRLEGETVLPRHAVVSRLSGGHLAIRPAVSGALVLVNGTAVGPEPTPLLHGDRLRIGEHEVIVLGPSRNDSEWAPDEAPTRLDPALVEGAGRLISQTDGREYRIAVVPFTLGWDASAQVVVDAPNVARRHAEIVSRPDGDILVDLSSSGTFVNGERISGRHRLQPLDVLRIGTSEFRYHPGEFTASMPALGAELRLRDTLVGLTVRAQPVPLSNPTARPLASLRIKSGLNKGGRIPVWSPSVTIGRADVCEVRFNDPTVSLAHAKLLLRDGVWSISDLGSANGTWVDGVVVEDDAPLSPGSTLLLGGVVVSFEPQDEPVRRPEPVAAGRTAEGSGRTSGRSYPAQLAAPGGRQRPHHVVVDVDSSVDSPEVEADRRRRRAGERAMVLLAPIAARPNLLMHVAIAVLIVSLALLAFVV
ncbi:MAG: FHA domain-containing protein [Gemmatimonadales bacterium]|nr:FHA domain-containing protein [Gemmatimonadales bacterium]